MFFKPKEPPVFAERTFGAIDYASHNGILAVEFHSQDGVPGRMASKAVLRLKVHGYHLAEQLNDYVHEHCKEAVAAKCDPEVLVAYELNEQCKAEAQPRPARHYEDHNQERGDALARKKDFQRRVREHYEPRAHQQGIDVNELVREHFGHVSTYQFVEYEEEHAYRRQLAKNIGKWDSEALSMHLFFGHVQDVYEASGLGVSPDAESKRAWQKFNHGGMEMSDYICLRVDDPTAIPDILRDMKNIKQEPLFSKAELESIKRMAEQAKRDLDTPQRAATNISASR